MIGRRVDIYSVRHRNRKTGRETGTQRARQTEREREAALAGREIDMQAELQTGWHTEASRH